MEERDEKKYIRIRESTSYTYSIKDIIIVLVDLKFANID